MKSLYHHIVLAFVAAAAAALSVSAVEPSETYRRMASNYYAYPYPAQPVPELTATPDGYTPYHIEHYGRHGSRWHIGTGSYRRPVEMLAKADAAGKLTPRGKELLGQLRDIEVASRGRDGELTDVGAEQHRGIARRMISNFPEVFEGPARVDARSTVVIRCILSMDNELQELKAANPALIVTSDASRADMPYMNFSDTGTVAQQAARKADSLLKDFGKTHRYMDDFLPNIVTDTQWAKDSLDTGALFYYLFNIAANAQSHKDMPAPYDIFSDREMRERWEYNNAAWFTTYGNMEVSEGLASYNQRRLLDNMLSSADSTLTSTYPSANLRFGHEVVVMPLVVFMELDNYGKEINDLNQVASQWRDWEIFPMACNVQMVFYRPTDPGSGKPVLVKVLLNEREVSLPVAPVAPGSPYVVYDDLRSYYAKKLARVPLY